MALAERQQSGEVLAEAFANAGRSLGMSTSDLLDFIGDNHSFVSLSEIDPYSGAGKQALKLVQLYLFLHELMGGNQLQMQHWMKIENLHTKGVPLEQVKTSQGLARVLEYVQGVKENLV